VLAANGAGAAAFAWTTVGGRGVLKTRARSAAGVVTPVVTVAASGDDDAAPQVAMDATGDTVLTWARHDGTAYAVLASIRDAGGTLGPAQTISPAGPGSGFPRLAVSPAGDAIVTWQGFGGSSYRAYARRLSAQGAVGPLLNVSPPGPYSNDPTVAMSAGGDAVFAWQGSDGVDHRIRARTLSAAGAFGPAETLSAAGQTAAEPHVAVDGDGDALVAWRRFDGAKWRAQGAAGP
jgi:hypothetical protein